VHRQATLPSAQPMTEEAQVCLGPTAKAQESVMFPRLASYYCDHPLTRVSAPQPEALRNSFFGQRKPNQSANQTGVVTNIAHLAQLVDAGYNRGRYGPISVVPATLKEGAVQKAVYLVTISGTELVTDRASGRPQSTGMRSNLQLMLHQETDALVNARDVIIRQVPQGSTLVLAGHSQGGVIAQQLAADPLIQKRFNIMNTIAFGSPPAEIGRRAGEVRTIAAFGDPFPSMHWAHSDFWADQWSTKGHSIPSRFTHNSRLRGIQAHMNDYTDEENPENQRIDALGRKDAKVPATLSIDLAHRRFFSSPRR
jgi:hypothetical protein